MVSILARFHSSAQAARLAKNLVFDSSTVSTMRRLMPRAGATYSRITVLAITDSNKLPSPAEGVNRLVVTKSFDPLLTPVTSGKKTGSNKKETRR